jgi:hypothetical protein
VVGEDLADAFRLGAAYLTQSVDWALGTRRDPPDTAAAAVTAGIRLDEALRGYLAEQGAKRLPKEDLWMLVTATMQLRLTATTLTALRAPEHDNHHHQGIAQARATLEHDTTDLAGFYERVAVLVDRPAPDKGALPVSVPAFVAMDGNRSTFLPSEVSEVGGSSGTYGADHIDGASQADGTGEAGRGNLLRIITARNLHLLFVEECLQYLSSHARAATGPALQMAEQRRLPWWR